MQFGFNRPALGVLCYIVFYPGNWNRTIFMTSSYSVQIRVSKSGIKLCFCKMHVKESQGALPKGGLKRPGVGLQSGPWFFCRQIFAFLSCNKMLRCFEKGCVPLAVGGDGNLLGRGRAPVCSFPSSLQQIKGHWWFAVLHFQNLVSFPVCPLIHGLSLGL